MLTPAYANFWTHFYPIGNTPAICLTQGLPPEKKADALLLGCGDLRNVLFTIYSDGQASILWRGRGLAGKILANLPQKAVRWTSHAVTWKPL